MTRTLSHGPHAGLRRDVALGWLTERAPHQRVHVVGATVDAGMRLLRRAAASGPRFGWQAMTLEHLAARIADRALALSGRVPASPAAVEAVCARVVSEATGEGTLGRFQPLAGFPGLPRALARALTELRLAGIPAARAGDLSQLLASFESVLEDHALADVAHILQVATRHAADAPPASLLLLDAPLLSRAHEGFLAALVARAPDVLAVAPSGDEGTLARLGRAVGAAPTALEHRATSSLGRLQRRLFGSVATTEEDPLDESVAVFSAPGENRECVEIARRIHAAADRGVPYDRIAVALRAPEIYRASLEEVLGRAHIPFWSGFVRRPDRAGRALLALLACAAEGLSARRFAEYLSLDQVPRPTAEGAPPDAAEEADRFVPSEEALLVHPSTAPTGEPLPTPHRLPTPRRWEAVIVDAAVIGGAHRWKRRLDGKVAEIELQLSGLDDDEPLFGSLTRQRREVETLRAFALPLIEDLAALPGEACWGTWLEHLTALASRALRSPERVLELLGELQPMAPIGPVSLTEIRLALRHRLRDLVERPRERPFGRVLIGPPEALRGMEFAVVFAPGLAERVFPHKVLEDPLLLDVVRTPLALETNDDRIARERTALRIAVGAARDRVVLSWSRLGTDENRPRVPSFYGLEALRAATGVLPSFDELMRKAQTASRTRLGWPAPDDPKDAIDDTEFDLAVLDPWRHATRGGGKGAARYLVERSPILARALRARWSRWNDRRLKNTDGLIATSKATKEALARHRLDQRSYSPTALEKFTQCPYRFALHSIFRLEPREEPEPLEALDPLSRGSLIHDVQYRLMTELAEQGALPVTVETQVAVRAHLDGVLDEVAARYEDDLAPAIPTVFEDAIGQIRADLREWLRLMVNDPEWTPRNFELCFGLTHRDASDPNSQDEPAALDCGIKLRGAIDLVEERRDGALRATDYKTGKVRPDAKRFIVHGGSSLQPVFYALAAEKMLGRKIVGGTLYFCTHRGGFEKRDVPLDERARHVAEDVAIIIGKYLKNGLLPAAPDRNGCRYCDYLSVCGPREEYRMGKKEIDQSLSELLRLRALP